MCPKRGTFKGGMKGQKRNTELWVQNNSLQSSKGAIQDQMKLKGVPPWGNSPINTTNTGLNESSSLYMQACWGYFVWLDKIGYDGDRITNTGTKTVSVVKTDMEWLWLQKATFILVLDHIHWILRDVYRWISEICISCVFYVGLLW